VDGREVGALHGLLGWTDQKLEIYVDGALDTSLYTDCSDGRINRYRPAGRGGVLAGGLGPQCRYFPRGFSCALTAATMASWSEAKPFTRLTPSH